MSSLRRCLNWLCRFRHRCGYGIHSPFAFNFVTGVVYEKGEYYAYDRLQKLHAQNGSPLSSSKAALRRKDLRLLFRLANFQRPARAWLFGASADSAFLPWLKAGSVHTHWHTDACAASSAVNLIVADGNWPQAADRLLQSLAEGGMLVVFNIWQSRERRQAWQRILSHPHSTVAFDLRDFGIVFRRPDLNRQHYKVCYF